jgi:hypothetical protein
VQGVSQASPTYAGLAVFMVILCAAFAAAWLSAVAASMYRASVRAPTPPKPSPGVAQFGSGDGTTTAVSPLTGRRDRVSVARAAPGDLSSADVAGPGTGSAPRAVVGTGVGDRPAGKDVTAVNPLFVRVHPQAHA